MRGGAGAAGGGGAGAEGAGGAGAAGGGGGGAAGGRVAASGELSRVDDDEGWTKGLALAGLQDGRCPCAMAGRTEEAGITVPVLRTVPALAQTVF